MSSPYGIRTRVTCVRGRRPWPLDERAVLQEETLYKTDRLVPNRSPNFPPHLASPAFPQYD